MRFHNVEKKPLITLLLIQSNGNAINRGLPCLMTEVLVGT